MQIFFKYPTPARHLKLPQNPHAHFWEGAESLAPATENHILTSKSGPRPSEFNTFELQTWLLPQSRALFEHLNSKKCSKLGVLLACSLRNVLCATTPCAVSTAQLQKVIRARGVLCMLSSKGESRRNAVHYSNAITPNSALRMGLCAF